MIIEGGTHGNAGNLARYLLRQKEGETPFLFELRDAASENLTEALTDWEVAGRMLTKGRDILFHSYIRLPQGEALAEAQWYTVIERLEEKLGLANCPRAVVGHNSEHGLHVHIAWSRFDAATEKLAPLHHSRRQFHDVARWAEKEFNLEPAVKPTLQKAPKKRGLSSREMRALKDRGVKRDHLEKVMRAAWNGTTGGEEMQAMLRALGCEIQAGDRRSFVLDCQGMKINPVRLLDGVTETAFRKRMEGVELHRDTDRTRGVQKRQAQELTADTAKARIDEKPVRQTRFTSPKRTRGPQPKLKPKIWFGDPGI